MKAMQSHYRSLAIELMIDGAIMFAVMCGMIASYAQPISTPTTST